MVVSWNRSTPQSSSISMGCSLFHQPFWASPIYGSPQTAACRDVWCPQCITPCHARLLQSHHQLLWLGTCDPISARLSRDLPQWLKSCQSCLSFMEDAEKMVVHLNGSERMWHRLAPMGTVFFAPAVRCLRAFATMIVLARTAVVFVRFQDVPSPSVHLQSSARCLFVGKQQN